MFLELFLLFAIGCCLAMLSFVVGCLVYDGFASSHGSEARRGGRAYMADATPHGTQPAGTTPVLASDELL